jgi:hypothetical protein
MQTHHSSRLVQSVQLLQLLAQIFWRWATPFWLFRDASRGTKEQRSANYRYNRAQRGILPSYALKWLAIAICMLLLLQTYSDMLAPSLAGTPAYFYAVLFCVSAGIAFAFACIVIAVLMTCYVFLSQTRE